MERGLALRVGGVRVGADLEERGDGAVVALLRGEVEGGAAVHGLRLGLRAAGDEEADDLGGVDVRRVVQGRAGGLGEGGVRIGAGVEPGGGV